jgi:hypothetical protein
MSEDFPIYVRSATGLVDQVSHALKGLPDHLASAGVTKNHSDMLITHGGKTACQTRLSFSSRQQLRRQLFKFRLAQ